MHIGWPGLRTAASIALLAAGGASACAGLAGAAAGPPPEAALRIRLGETAAAGAGALTIRFESVASDSRCAKGETCVWEGDGVVVLAVAGDGAEPARLELHTSSRGAAAAGFAGWTIRLVSLEPYPVAGRAIDPSAYVATLSVARGGDGGAAIR